MSTISYPGFPDVQDTLKVLRRESQICLLIALSEVVALSRVDPEARLSGVEAGRVIIDQGSCLVRNRRFFV